MKKLVLILILSLVATFQVAANDFEFTPYQGWDWNKEWGQESFIAPKQQELSITSSIEVTDLTVEETVKRLYGDSRLYKAVKRGKLKLFSFDDKSFLYLGFSKPYMPEFYSLERENKIRDPELGIRIHF